MENKKLLIPIDKNHSKINSVKKKKNQLSLNGQAKKEEEEERE